MYAACRRVLACHQDAEDACQAAFLALAAKAPARPWDESVAGWLYAVALRVARKIRAATARRAHHEIRSAAWAADRPPAEPGTELSARELRTALDDELARLPKKYRAPLVLCLLGGLTRDEAARRLGWPLGTLKSRVERGRRLLAARLARRGLGVPVALAAAVLADTGRAAPEAGALVRAAANLAAGQPVPAGLVSASALRLARGVLSGTSRIQSAVAVLLTLVFIAGGGGLVARRVPAADGPTADGPRSGALVGGQPRLDPAGDPLPPDALVRLGTRRFRQDQPVRHVVAPLPGGRLVASAGPDTVYLWDASTGEERRRWRVEPESARIQCFGCSPDGTVLATGHYDGAVRLWDPARAEQVRSWQSHAGPPIPSPGDRTRHPPANSGVVDLAFSPDGKGLFTAGHDKRVVLWNPATGAEVRRLASPEGIAIGLNPSPNGKLLAAREYADFSRPSNVLLWEVESGRLTRRLAGSGSRFATALAFAPDGCRLAAGFGFLPDAPTEVMVWEVPGGREVATLDGHRVPTAAIRFAADGRILLLAGLDGVRTWEPGGKKAPEHTPMPLRGFSLAFTTDGQSLVGLGAGFHSAVRFWDVATGRERPGPSGCDGPVGSVAFSPDGKLAATAEKGFAPVRLWDTSTGLERNWPGAKSPLPSSLLCQFAPDGRALWLVGHDGPIVLRDLMTGEELRRLPASDHTRVAAASGDGRFLAGWADRDKKVRVWEAATGREVRAIPLPHAEIGSLALSSDGRAVASAGSRFGDGDGKHEDPIRVWEVATGKPLRRPELAPGLAITEVAFSPDGRTLAGAGWEAGEPVVLLWDVAGGARLRIEPGCNVVGVAFSPNGRLVTARTGGAVGYQRRRDGDDLVRVWDARTGAEVHRFVGHSGAVTAVAFNPDGSILASGGADATALLWALPETTRPGAPAPSR